MSRDPFLPIPSTGIPRLDPTLKKPRGYDNWGHVARDMWWLGDPTRKRKWQEAMARLEDHNDGGDKGTITKRVHIKDRPPFVVTKPVSMLDPVAVASDAETNQPKTTPTGPPASAPPPPTGTETTTQPSTDEFDNSYNTFLEAQRKETEAVSFPPRTFAHCHHVVYVLTLSVFVLTR
jgi:hypothetical protein